MARTVLSNVAGQPIELAKLALCIFFASYFVEKRELLSVPTLRVGNRLMLDPRPLVPILIAWAFTMVVLGGEADIGFALLIFVLFMAMLWLTWGLRGASSTRAIRACRSLAECGCRCRI